MSDANVEVSIDATKNTGAIDETAAQIGGLGQAAEEIQGKLLELASVAAIGEFFRQSIELAEQESESLRRLSFTLHQNGLSFAENEGQIKSWKDEAAAATRFSANEYVDALDKAANATKDLGAANEIVRTAMDLSVAKNKTLAESVSILTSLMSGNQRAAISLSREFPGLVSATDSAQEVLTKLQNATRGAADAEDDLTKSSAQLRHSIQETQKEIGEFLIPGLKSVVDWWNHLGNSMREVAGVDPKADKVTQALQGQITKTKEIIEANKDWVGTGRVDVDAYIKHLADLEKALAAHKDAIKGVTTAVADESQKRIALHAAAGRQDLAQMLEETKAQVEAIKAAEAQQLAVKNQTSAQRLAIVKSALAQELAALDAHHAAYKNKEVQFQAEVSKLRSEAALKSIQIEQKFTIDRVAQLEQWAARHKDVVGNVQSAALQASDAMAAGFANAVAKSIVEGKNLESALKQTMTQVAEQIIADLIRIEIEAAVAKAALLIL